MYNWETLKEDVYYEDGSLRDMYILETDKRDWESWSKLVNENFAVEFYDGLTQTYESRINIDRVFEFWNDSEKFTDSNKATIAIDNVLIKCYFFTTDEIENDIDPREVKTDTDHLNIVLYLKAVAKTLKKDVLLTCENLQDQVLLKIKKSSG